MTFACPAPAQDKTPEKSKPTERKPEPAASKKDATKTEPKGERHSAAETAECDSMTGPCEEHKRLEGLVGQWNFTIKYAEELGGGESKGASEFSWAMGGRFLVETTRTDMGGVTLEWMGWHGYDGQKKMYVGSWIDNFSTKIQNMTGRYDNATNTLTYVGEEEDAVHGGKQNVKWVITLEGKDKFTTKMIEGVGNGKERVVMEIKATRS
jgi:hypothetical protein